MKPNKKINRSLQEIEGIPQPENVSASSINQIRASRRIQPSALEIIQGICNQEISALSRAITLIESNQPAHQEKATTIISQCLTLAKPSIRIGITGVPGVGKSTFIEAFGKHLTSIGKKLAVLAIDPSSTISLGSILGDKTRMEELVKDPYAFIRPSPTSGTLGGVARKTRETISICEAFGFDVIIIETVGVGQSETAVHNMVDFFILLNISGAGDELQGIKRGIMEMADLVVINKADGDMLLKAKSTKTEFNRALHLFPSKKSGWVPSATTCSAIIQEGIGAIWDTVSQYIELTTTNHYFEERRKEQDLFLLFETIDSELKSAFYQNEKITPTLQANSKLVEEGVISPFIAAQNILKAYFEK